MRTFSKVSKRIKFTCSFLCLLLGSAADAAIVRYDFTGVGDFFEDHLRFDGLRWQLQSSTTHFQGGVFSGSFIFDTSKMPVGKISDYTDYFGAGSGAWLTSVFNAPGYIPPTPFTNGISSSDQGADLPIAQHLGIPGLSSFAANSSATHTDDYLGDVPGGNYSQTYQHSYNFLAAHPVTQTDVIDGIEFPSHWGPLNPTSTASSHDLRFDHTYVDGVLQVGSTRDQSVIIGSITSLTRTISGEITAVDAQPATETELAAMARATYGDIGLSAVDTFQLLNGGTIGSRTDGASVYAESYIRYGAQGGRDQIVIAIRGTQEKEDWLNRNGSFALAATETFQDDSRALASLVGQLAELHPGADFTFTGHSLGGGFSQALGDILNIDSVAFNAPGSKNLLTGISDELRFLASKDSGTDPYSKTENLKNIRFYRDQVSKFGSQFDDPAQNQIIETMMPGEAQWLAINSAQPVACFFYCHSMSRIINGFSGNNDIVYGFGDEDSSFSIPIQALIIGVGIVKIFDQDVDQDDYLFFDPTGAGEILQIDMLDSDVSLNGIFLPSFGTVFEIWGLSGTNWNSLGQFDGFSFSKIDPYFSYRINNANLLMDDSGGFLVGLKFENAGTFRGSFQIVDAPAVPEPMSWLTMTFGFGLLGFIIRTKTFSIIRQDI